jgi:hypothetical protein
MAEGVRFELTRPFGLPVFKTGAIDHSATPPEGLRIVARKLITPLRQHSKSNHAAELEFGSLEQWENALDIVICSCELST